MKLKGSILLALAASALLTFAQSTLAAETAKTRGEIAAVTVYQGQALVTREVELDAGQGLREVVITDLPDHVIPSSIYAEPVGDAEIRSVSYRVRPVEQDVRDEVRELDDQLQAAGDQIAAHQSERQLLAKRKQYLDSLEQFTAGTGQQELTHGVLDANTLKELSQFLFDQRQEIAHRELEVGRQLREGKSQLQLLTRQKEQLTSGSALNVREAVVFVNVPDDNPLRLRLRYLVSQANWSPSYNLRANSKRNEILVEYNASVEQMSGEDWNDVEMTLSTATLSLVAKAPTLEPLAIRLGAPEESSTPGSAVSGDSRGRQKQQLESELRDLAKSRGQANVSSIEPAAPGLGGGGFGGEPAQQYGGEGIDADVFGPTGDFFARAINTADAQLNSYSCAIQVMELASGGRVDREADAASDENAQEVSVSYQLANRTSLPSRSDRQLIQIAAIDMQGEFYRLAVPVLTDHVYQETRVVNSSDQVLLAGQVSTFVAGQFVGRGEIPTVAVGEGFTVGLGIDSSLRASRELAAREERIQGGNRVVDFTYELAIENFDGNELDVRLLDRLPTTDQSDIKLTLQDTEIELSDDANYRMTDHKNGILRWDVQVPADAVGPERYVMRYTMQLEYDKQKAITGDQPQP